MGIEDEDKGSGLEAAKQDLQRKQNKNQKRLKRKKPGKHGLPTSALRTPLSHTHCHYFISCSLVMVVCA